LSLLATIRAQTERVHAFADVGNMPLRPPAVLAKAAATLDLLSGGRSAPPLEWDGRRSMLDCADGT